MDYEKIISQRAIVSSRIEELLLENNFELSIDYLKYLHNYLFKDIIDNCGEFRTGNIFRNEDILNDDTVLYANYHAINSYLAFDFSEEKKRNYQNYSIDDITKYIAELTSKIWQVHPFINGNTRTVCVFIEKYLNELGYDVDNSFFSENAKYFRNTLVLSAYSNQELGIQTNLLPLTEFYKILLKKKTVNFSNYSLYVTKLFTPEGKKKILRRNK